MSLYDTADLLARCKRALNRPETDEGMTDPDWYAFMTEVQAAAYMLIAAHAPWALVGDPVKLTTADNRVYEFPTTPFPGGRIEIRATRTGELLRPGPEFDDGADYVFKGTQIRIPGNRSREFGDGPYARFFRRYRSAPSLTPIWRATCRTEVPFCTMSAATMICFFLSLATCALRA